MKNLHNRNKRIKYKRAIKRKKGAKMAKNQELPGIPEAGKEARKNAIIRIALEQFIKQQERKLKAEPNPQIKTIISEELAEIRKIQGEL